MVLISEPQCHALVSNSKPSNLVSWCGVGAWASTLTHAGRASEDRTAGIPGLGSKNTLGVSARRSHTQAAQCKVVMPPDGSVTRCLVCPAAADGSGPGSLSA